MVAAGIGRSIIPVSTLTQNEGLAAHVQELSVTAFDGCLNVWMLWNDQCQMIGGTAEALAQIFAAAEPRTTLRLATASTTGVPTRRHRRER
jgi:hypothetical protein